MTTMVQATSARHSVYLLLLLASSLASGLRYDYGNGSYYVGQVNQDGRPAGQGKFFNTEGRLEYEGQFASGQPHGNGTWYGPDGERLEGQFRHGKAHGHGVLRQKNGDKAEGDFVNHRPHGRVSVWRADGDRIEGQFKHGMPHGRVVWVRPHSAAAAGKAGAGAAVVRRMDGMFRMGRPHGHAKLYGPQGQVVYDGRFIHGRPAEPAPGGLDADTFKFAPISPAARRRR